MTRKQLMTMALAGVIATSVIGGSAFAQGTSRAYRYSGTHAGGPADALISSTGGVPKPVTHRVHDRAYRYSGTHAGGPADALISSTGSMVSARR